MKSAPVLTQVFAEESESEALIGAEIARFLDGETNGEALFDALYGDVMDEPIPAGLLAALHAAPAAPEADEAEEDSDRDDAGFPDDSPDYSKVVTLICKRRQ